MRPHVARDVFPDRNRRRARRVAMFAAAARVGGVHDLPGGREAPVAPEGPPGRVWFKVAAETLSVKLGEPARGVAVARGRIEVRFEMPVADAAAEPSSGVGGRTRRSEALGQAGSTSKAARLRASLLNSTPIR